MKRKYALLFTIVFSIFTFASNGFSVYALTQEELTQIMIKANEEKGFSLDDCRGTGGAHPELSIYNNNSSDSVKKESAKKEEKKHEHKYAANLTANPTCTEDGVLTYTCECGDSYTEAQPKLEHQYEETVTKEATCTMEGEKTFTCTLCKESYTEVINKAEHAEGQHKITKEPTCTETGTETVYCKDCIAEIKTIELDAKGHVAGEPVITKKANLFVDGESIITCTKCGDLLETNIVELSEADKVKQTCILAIIIGIIIAIPVTGIIIKKKVKTSKKP